MNPTVERLRRYNRIATLVPNPDDSFLKYAWYVSRNEDAYMEAYALMQRENLYSKVPPKEFQTEGI